MPVIILFQRFQLYGQAQEGVADQDAVPVAVLAG